MNAKRLLIPFLLIALLCPAFAEDECQHIHLSKMATSHTVVEALEAGHYRCKITHTLCTDCYKRFVDKQFENLQGHTFHMAESVHGQQEGMHLWIFICPECMHITMIEELCEGGRNCSKYGAQEGTTPAVQLSDTLAPWKETDAKRDIIRRWIAKNWESPSKKQ